MQERQPFIHWHGSKWSLAPWVIAHMPPHATYVEPFGGGAGVLARKTPSRREVYADLDDRPVAVIRVLQSARAVELVRAVAATPYSREAFEAAFGLADDPVEEARRLIVRAFQGRDVARSVRCEPTRFRSVQPPWPCPATAWAALPGELARAVRRFADVEVERADAVDVIRRNDSASTLFYLDPPYLGPTGRELQFYRLGMTEADHRRLLDVALGARGAVMLSGYANRLYETALRGWRQVECRALAASRSGFAERLWMNFDVDA